MFNWFGYRFVLDYMQRKAYSKLEARIDLSDYDESQLIEIRVALNMPYQNNRSAFERHYGEVELNGEVYAYVKRKVENGFLILKCIPNQLKQKITKADNDLFIANNGFDKEQNSKNNLPLRTICKNITTVFENFSPDRDLIILIDLYKRFQFATTPFVQSVCLSVSEEPPENFRFLQFA